VAVTALGAAGAVRVPSAALISLTVQLFSVLLSGGERLMTGLDSTLLPVPNLEVASSTVSYCVSHRALLSERRSASG